MVIIVPSFFKNRLLITFLRQQLPICGKSRRLTFSQLATGQQLAIT